MRVAAMVACCALLASASCAGGRHVAVAKDRDRQRAEEEKDAREMCSAVKVPLLDALDAALEARPGEALAAELERRNGVPVFEVGIVDADLAAYTVLVDPGTGRVLTVERKEQAFTAARMRARLAALPPGHMVLGRLVERGTRAIEGTPFAAEFRGKKHADEAKVAFVSGGRLVSVRLDAVSGRVVAIDR